MVNKFVNKWWNSIEMKANMIEIESLKLSGIVLQTLRDMYDDSEARFKSEEQSEAVKLALQKTEDLLIILPTEGEKSLDISIASMI